MRIEARGSGCYERQLWGGQCDFSYGWSLADLRRSEGIVRQSCRAVGLSAAASTESLPPETDSAWVAELPVLPSFNLNSSTLHRVSGINAIPWNSKYYGVLQRGRERRVSLYRHEGSGSRRLGRGLCDYSFRSAVNPIPRRFGSGGFISCRIADRMPTIA
jgi:hypothetical protein